MWPAVLSSETTLLIQMSGLSYHNHVERGSSPFPPPLSNHYGDLDSWLTEIHLFSKCTKLILLMLFLRIKGVFLALIYGTVTQERIRIYVNHSLASGVCLQSKREKSAAAVFNACRLLERGESRQAWQIFFQHFSKPEASTNSPRHRRFSPCMFWLWNDIFAVFDFWVYHI